MSKKQDKHTGKTLRGMIFSEARSGREKKKFSITMTYTSAFHVCMFSRFSPISSRAQNSLSTLETIVFLARGPQPIDKSKFHSRSMQLFGTSKLPHGKGFYNLGSKTFKLSVF